MLHSILLLFSALSVPVLPSDKGICAEVREGGVRLICETTIIKELRPAVHRWEVLLRSKMAGTAMKEEEKKIDAVWEQVSKKHREALSRSGWSARLRYVGDEYLGKCSRDAWALAKEKCPRKTTSKDTSSAPFFVLKRYLTSPEAGS